MSATLEITKLSPDFPFRSFINDGSTLACHHWHKEVEIIFVQQGILKIGVNDELIHLKEGEFFLINSGDIHYFLPSPDSLRIVIQFDLSIFEDTQFLKGQNTERTKLLDCVEKSSLQWEEQTKEKMITYLQDLYQEYTEQKIGYELAIRARLYDMLLLIYRDVPKLEQKKSVHSNQKENLLKLEKIFCYIDEYYQEDISLSSISAYIGFTPSYFSKFFKKLTGINFWHYLNQYRLTKAQWHLFNEDIAITEISYRVGFTNVKTFNRLFKKEIGISPSQYRKRQYLRSFV